MKIRLNKRHLYLMTGAVLLLAATPSFALFGLGDIVFDPTSYGSLVQQAATALSELRTMEAAVTHFSFKQEWHTALMQVEQANIRDLNGETDGMTTALNTDSPAASSTSWASATVPVNTTTDTYLREQTPGSTQLSELAMIEASDSVSPDCLTAVGQYRAGRAEDAAANNSLASSQLDGSTATNSEVEQLNLLNAAHAQQMSEMESQGVLQACLASEMAVRSMRQRDAAAIDLNTAAFVAQQHAANDASAANEGNTWDSYLP
jgi:hypothetical protein